MSQRFAETIVIEKCGFPIIDISLLHEKNVGVAGGATPTVSWGEDNRTERGERGRAVMQGDYSRMMRKAAVLPAEVVAVSR